MSIHRFWYIYACLVSCILSFVLVSYQKGTIYWEDTRETTCGRTGVNCIGFGPWTLDVRCAYTARVLSTNVGVHGTGSYFYEMSLLSFSTKLNIDIHIYVC